MTPTHTPARERSWRRLRWAGGLLALALVPKCFVCLAAYVALATGLGTLGAEFCASPSARGSGAGPFTFDVWSLAGLILALSVAATALLVARRRRQLQSHNPCSRGR